MLKNAWSLVTTPCTEDDPRSQQLECKIQVGDSDREYPKTSSIYHHFQHFFSTMVSNIMSTLNLDRNLHHLMCMCIYLCVCVCETKQKNSLHGIRQTWIECCKRRPYPVNLNPGIGWSQRLTSHNRQQAASGSSFLINKQVLGKSKSGMQANNRQSYYERDQYIQSHTS